MEDDGATRNSAWLDEFSFKLTFEGYLISFLEVINTIKKKNNNNNIVAWQELRRITRFFLHAVIFFVNLNFFYTVANKGIVYYIPESYVVYLFW